jgi:hypothetical protein
VIPPEPGGEGKQEGGEESGGGEAVDLNRLEMGGEEEEDEQPRFIGDDALLYSHTAESSASRRMMVFLGEVDGRQAVVLLDTGANANFVSQGWARRYGLVERPMKAATEVTTATGRTHAATTQVEAAEVSVVGKLHRSSLIVVPLNTYDVILGTPWFKATQPQFDWEQWTCNGYSVYAQGGRSVGHPGRTSRRLQSMVVGAGHQAVMDRLLRKYGGVFAAKLPPRTAREGALMHSFTMKAGARPVVDGERRKSPEELRLAREMVAEGEATGLIEPSTSEWCSQLVMVMKKDQHGHPTGKPRFAVDYRRVNELMKKDAHPLPLPEVMFAQLKGATVFSKLDLTKGFYQIALDPACREPLAFSTPDGLRQWTVMPFGVANAPATFQREMQRVFRVRLDRSVLVYIDDILIFSCNAEEHAEHVEWVLQQLQQNGYYANPDKCEFFQQQVNFLGHVISAGGVAVQQHKVEAVERWPTPQSVSDVRRFLGLAGYYRRFVRGFSDIAGPLSDLTKKEAPFVWGAKEETAFARLKAALVSAPVLITPDNAKPYTVHTDASGYAVGATLSQENAQGLLQPVAFLSKKMNAAQRNYPVHEWELLAIMEALKAWRCFLYGAAAPIDIYTDHHSLQWISSQPNLSARQSRWVEQLQDYSFVVHHLAGDKNGAADALSRRADYEAAHAAEADARMRAGDMEAARGRLRLQVAAMTRSRSRAPAVEETDVSQPAGAEEAKRSPTTAEEKGDSPEVRGRARSSIVAPALMDDIRLAAVSDEAYYKPLLEKADHLGLVVRDGLLYSAAGLLYIPKDDAVRSTLMREVHDAPTGGHLGREKTYSRLTEWVYWQGVYHDVRDYVRSCVSCAQNKASNRTAADLLHPLPIPARRWETISMDFVGPLPKTSAGHDFLLVVMDKFSKMVHLFACTRVVTASQVAQLVYDGVVRLHGFPECIVSDRDTRFTSHFWRALWKLSGTQLAMSTSYHPQTDGQTENVNRVVQDILRAYVSDSRRDWDRYLTATEIAINSSRHASTGYTPFFLNHRQEVRLPYGIALKEAVGSATVPAAARAMGEMAANDEAARGRMAEAQAQQEEAANRHRREEKWEVGEQAMLSTKHLAGYKHKLACRFIGPFPVVEVGTGTVRLELPRDMKVHDRVNVDRVKRYAPSVGEWTGRSQESRPLPVQVSDDGQGEYEVEAILGKRESMEEVPSAPEDGEVAAGGGSRRKKARRAMVTRYLVQWAGYSMDDCSWERESNLVGARSLVTDYERRLQAGESGHPSVMMLCVGERMRQ